MCGCLAQERRVKKVPNSLTWFSQKGDLLIGANSGNDDEDGEE